MSCTVDTCNLSDMHALRPVTLGLQVYINQTYHSCLRMCVTTTTYITQQIKTKHNNYIIKPGAYKRREAARGSVNVMVLMIVKFLHANISKFGLTQLTPAASGFVT